MYALVVLATVACLAAADVSHLGYHYKVPHTSYGVPAYQQSSNNYNAGSGLTYKEQTLNHGYQGQGSGFGVQNAGGQAGWSTNQGAGYSQQNNGYQSAGFGQQHGGHQNSGLGQQTTGYQGTGFGQQQGSFHEGAGFGQQNTGHDAGSYAGNSGAVHQVSSGNQGQVYHSTASAGYFGGYKTSSQTHGSAGITVQQQPAQVFKHVYVHEAPEEPEQPRVRQQVVLPAPQKHYKIIFIKAPTSTVYAPKYIPVPQQNEEKTIVYVLSKKPEEIQHEVVPQIEAKPPTKPEVFFVKYQNKDESQQVINNIVQDYQKDGSTVFAGAAGSSGTGFFTQNNGAYEGSQQTDGSHAGGSGLYTQVQQSHYATDNGQHAQATGSFGSSSDATASTGTYNQVSNDFQQGVSGYEGTVDTLTSQGVPHTTYGTPFRA